MFRRNGHQTEDTELLKEFKGLSPGRGLVTVIGLGRFGSAVATELTRMKYDVMAVDKDMSKVEALTGELPFCFQGDGTDKQALKEMDIAKSKLVVVASASSVETSVLTVANLVDLKVENIWAKALNPQHAHILQRIGATRCVQPETAMGERLAHQVSGSMMEYLELDEEFSLVELKTPRKLLDKTLKDLHLRQNYHVNIVAVKKQNQKFTYPDADILLEEGDILVATGKSSDLARFSRLN